ncbi:protein phosphatase 1 regulatory subunit 3C-like [Copidosoma floridanum]|uniref:protein phosphatase 1 regulatory subunit 3C-like n=1 Tax=Copidosoma floridanum TaxID=29053 RepID=UPI0006C93EDA|nr:protein phosphatase 1 regulatory subunit 3C-like [Copidosoma floridanum]XP_014203320.1 protein phosphatase 1 regulatory subunit 3C-like [Copidosoma floridanum]XP_014203321.1 protein phosphatase 1 regulatory subunit 3C-like [Copidosoma floridanum]XP_014203322.1 protein phosphatase 1 regulatory subunit 3C-like [Copidosoma floridanum]XP_014203323.1 protein phosphatase 1 regulatory subunit 3C-like [Copidosoma floridanum]
MCSIAIPAELLLGHSPPVYGSLLYSSLMVTTPPIANRTVPPQIRPCLTQGSLQLVGLLKGSSSNNGNDDANNSNKQRNKKRVVFADDRGRPLTQVRVMSEPSNMPPLWTSAYVASLAHGGVFRNLDGSLASTPQNGSSSSSVDCTDSSTTPLEHAGAGDQPWEACFPQPASDYLAFRGKLESNLVSLENVIVRETEGCLVGTVKVKNVDYDKEVTLRVTTDNWRSYVDVGCSYVEQPGLARGGAVPSLYDTFRFRVALPRTEEHRQVEFCVRYRCAGQEHWDNNAGANYVVKKKRDARASLEEQVAELLNACCGPSSCHSSFGKARQININRNDRPAGEATRVNLRTWSEFASWQHLGTDGPYW